MTVTTCAGCSTRYAIGLAACPHCGSSEVDVEGAAGRRLPLYTVASCDPCGKRWNFRLNQVQSGLIELSSLFCASCGSQVQVPWPPVEDDMPKITRNGGPSNVRDSETSPVALANAPLADAEVGQGHPNEVVLDGGDGLGRTPVEHPADGTESPEISGDGEGESLPVLPDYEAMSLSELKAAADERGVASYGAKSKIVERLRKADQEA